jgi:hypothetical protein
MIIVSAAYMFVLTLLDLGDSEWRIMLFPFWGPFWLAWLLLVRLPCAGFHALGKATAKRKQKKIDAATPPSPTEIMVHMLAQRIIKYNVEDCLSKKNPNIWRNPDTRVEIEFPLKKIAVPGDPPGNTEMWPTAPRTIFTDQGEIAISAAQGKELLEAFETARGLRKAREANAELAAKENKSISVIEQLMKLDVKPETTVDNTTMQVYTVA